MHHADDEVRSPVYSPPVSPPPVHSPPVSPLYSPCSPAYSVCTDLESCDLEEFNANIEFFVTDRPYWARQIAVRYMTNDWTLLQYWRNYKKLRDYHTKCDKVKRNKKLRAKNADYKPKRFLKKYKK